MHLSLLPVTLIVLLVTSHAASTTSKRGLVHVRNTLPSDEDPFKTTSSLTWYYNYQWDASPSLNTTTLSFVPMLWGAPATTNDTTFLKNMTALLNTISGGKTRRATVETAPLHVLGFNQPDEPFDRGGSNLSARDAAELWVANFVPLREKGVRVGLPCMQADKGPDEWLKPFLANCSAMMGEKSKREAEMPGARAALRKLRARAARWVGEVTGRLGARREGEKRETDSGCPFDFIPIHAFGNASAIQARVELYAKALNAPVWLTEWAPSNLPLASTQTNFNKTIEFLESSSLVERHAYFGSFRSTASNVGPNATMLDSWGRLTDLGAWYLGLAATGNDPVQTVAPAAGKSGAAQACTADKPCKGGSGRVDVGTGWWWLGVGVVTVLGGLI